MSGHPYLLSMFLTPFFYMNWLIQWILIYKHWTTIMCLKTALSMMAASPTSCPSGACGATGAAAACDVEAVWEQGGLKNGTFWVRYPVPSLKLTYPIPFMGLVYLPTWMCVCVFLWSSCRQIYQSHGFYGYCWWFRNPKQPPGMYQTQ